MLDEAENRRPPTGLFDPRAADPPQEPTPSDFRVLSSQTPDAQLAYPTTTPDSSDMLVQRLLDKASNSRPPMGLFDPTTSELPRVEAPPQPQQATEWPRTPTVAGIIAGAGIGGNMPTIRDKYVPGRYTKSPQTMGSKTLFTSPKFCAR
jgi:hypothetical protein